MDTPAPINIVFDDRPRPESGRSGRFVKGQTDEGRVTHSGEWQQSPDGCWKLRITALPTVTPKPEQDVHPDPEEDLMQRILAECFKTDISAVHAAGACHAVGVLLLAKAYKLIKDPERESE